MRNTEPRRGHREILSSSDFAAAIHEKLNEPTPQPAFKVPERIAEAALKRIIAHAIRERLLLAIKLGQTCDFTGEDLIRNFVSQIDYIWRGLIKSPDEKSVDFRVMFEHWIGRKPVSIIAVEGGLKRVEDAMMVSRAIKWVTGGGRLFEAFKEGVEKEASVIKTCLDEFWDLTYPGFLGGVLAAGHNITVYHASFARLYMRQGGESGRDVTLCFYWRRQFRWIWAPEKILLRGEEAPKGYVRKFKAWFGRLQWPLEPTKKFIISLDVLDVWGRNARIDPDLITATCGEVFLLITAITKKFGSPAHLDFHPIEEKRLGNRKHRGGVTPNSNALPPLKPLYASA